MKYQINHGGPGKIQFSDFSSKYLLKETKPDASSFPDLF
jgi:glutamine synthetase type III